MTPVSNSQAKDLSVEEPRAMGETLAGYAWLPRMIDKARAARAGTLGDYYRYPCPIDSTCLERLGIDSESFANIAQGSATDADVVEQLQRAGATPPEQAAFDPVELNNELHKDGS